MNRALNFAGFQAAWWGAVLSAAAGRPRLGAALVAAWLAAHLTFAADRRREAELLTAAAAGGWVADSLGVLAGWLDFPSHAGFGRPSSLWMALLWPNFAATLRHSLSWTRGRLGTAAVLGAAGGPAAYGAGAALGALEIEDSTAAWAFLAVEWALATPLLVWFAHREEGRR